MSGIGIRTRGSNSSSLFPEARVFILLSSMYLCQRISDSFVLSEFVQTDDYMFQARMFSGVMTGISSIRVCDEFCFCCVLLIFSESGIFGMDDDSSGLVFQKSC